MTINLQDMTINFRGSEENIYDLAQEISTKNIGQIVEILNELNKGLPKILKTRALRLVLNDFVRIAKELPITTELLHRLNWYKEYSDYQLSKLFTTLANSGDVRFNENELIANYKKWLWVVTLSNADNLNLNEDTLEQILNVEDEYLGFEDFNNTLSSLLYDFNGSIDVVPEGDFLRVLFKSSTVAELRDIAAKYEINVPKRLNRAQLLEVILERLEEDGKSDEAVVAKVKDMKVVSLQRFAKDNDIKASTELRKDAVIDFILKAVENNKSNLKSAPLVDLYILPEEEFEMKPEFIREIDSRYFYEFDEDGEIISMSDVEDLKAQIEELKAQQESERQRYEELMAQGLNTTEEVTTTETIEEYDLDPITRRMKELEKQIEILNENQRRESENTEADELKIRELELLRELEEAKQNDLTEKTEALERELEEVKNRQEEITTEVTVTTEEVIIEEDNEEAIRLTQELEEARLREEELLAREEEIRNEALAREEELLAREEELRNEALVREEEARNREEELLRELEEAKNFNAISQDEIIEEENEDFEDINHFESINLDDVSSEEIYEDDNNENQKLAEELEALKEKEEELLKELEIARSLNSVEQEEILLQQLEENKQQQEEITVTEVVVTEEYYEEDNSEIERLAQELDNKDQELETLREKEEELLRELELARSLNSVEQEEILLQQLEENKQQQEEITVTEVVVTEEIIEVENEEAIRLAQELEESRVREEELLAREEELLAREEAIKNEALAREEELLAREEELLRELELARLENSVEQEEILLQQLEENKQQQEEIITEVVVTEEIIINDEYDVESASEAQRLAQELAEKDKELELLREKEEELLRELEEKDSEDEFSSNPTFDDMEFENISSEEEEFKPLEITDVEEAFVEELEELQEYIPEDIEFDDVSIEDIDLMDEIDQTVLEEESTVVEESIENHQIFSLDDSTLNKKQLKAKKEIAKLLKEKEKLERYKKMKDSKLVKKHRAQKRNKWILRIIMLLLILAIYLFVVIAGMYRFDNGITSLFDFWSFDSAGKFGSAHIDILDSISMKNYQVIYDFIGKAHDTIMGFIGY